MSDNDVLEWVKDAMSEIHMHRPVEAIVARGRSRRAVGSRDWPAPGSRSDLGWRSPCLSWRIRNRAATARREPCEADGVHAGQ